MPVQETLSQIADQLGVLGAVAEQRFLEIGRSLELAVGIADRLATTFGMLFAELEGAELAQARHDLGEAAQRIGTLSEVQQRRVAALDTLAGTVGSMGGRVAAMHAVLREVDVLALNARLVAVGMGEAGAGFLLFASEIRRSAMLARGKLDQLAQELAGADRNLRAARASTHGFAQRQAGAMQTIPRDLTASVASIEARGRVAADAVAAVGARSQKIGRQVGAAIAALQLGDITRQRIEHAHRACILLRDSCQQEPAMPALVCRLMAAQLLDTADVLDREADRVVGQLQAMAADACEVAGLADLSYGTSNRQRGSFLTEVESGVRQAQGLFAALDAAYAEAHEQIAIVSGAAQHLVGHIAAIRTMDADIRIMGLNTTLKCGRLGAIGRPLSVIAQELRDCGGRTAMLATAVLADLHELLATADSLADGGREHGVAVVIDVGRGMMDAVQRLNETGQRLATALAGLDADSDGVGGLLATAVERFTVRHEISKVLRQAAADCLRLGELGDGADAGDGGASVERVLSLIAGEYTMVREREVHARFAPLSGAEVAAPRSAEAELADMLF
jgi:hypothetical protein